MMHHKLPFDKIHACGNDFILLSEIDLQHTQIVAMCKRRHGLGADGIMVFAGCDGNRIRLDHYDSDGSRSFCLNGIRAALACLHKKDLIPGTGLVSSEGVNLDYKVAAHVQITLPVKSVEWLGLEVGETTVHGYYCDVGNPQFVITESMPDDQFTRLAPQLRHHAHFPDGANINLVRSTENNWRIRSFERGVEEFTRACGSGMYAAANVLFCKTEQTSLLFVPDGQGLVRVIKKDDENMVLEGPTHHVASGEWL